MQRLGEYKKQDEETVVTRTLASLHELLLELYPQQFKSTQRQFSKTVFRDEEVTAFNQFYPSAASQAQLPENQRAKPLQIGYEGDLRKNELGDSEKTQGHDYELTQISDWKDSSTWKIWLSLVVIVLAAVTVIVLFMFS